ncbi:hypothetical protein LINPERPRIM_LOCUS21108, partial [Linum perenne]
LTFRGVPPALVTHEGVSWLASQIGTPIKKLIRDGLDVKVCAVKEVSVVFPPNLMVVLEGGEQSTIPAECSEPRFYKHKENSVYVPKVAATQPKVMVYDEGCSGNASKPSPDGEEAPKSFHHEVPARGGWAMTLKLLCKWRICPPNKPLLLA